jgi:hypothetical protein
VTLIDPMGLQNQPIGFPHMPTCPIRDMDACESAFHKCMLKNLDEVGMQTYTVPKWINAILPEACEVIVGGATTVLTKNPKAGAAAGVATGVALNMVWPDKIQIRVQGMTLDGLRGLCGFDAAGSADCRCGR